jgi:hypothetical protein
MHYTEWTEDGSSVQHEISWDLLDPGGDNRIEEARIELTTHWGASESGAKKNPDNAHGPGIFFWARVPWEERRICPVIEVGFPWRRGAGVRIGVHVYGFWIPWRRPPRPKLDTPERIDLSPAELLGEAA